MVLCYFQSCLLSRLYNIVSIYSVVTFLQIQWILICKYQVCCTDWLVIYISFLKQGKDTHNPTAKLCINLYVFCKAPVIVLFSLWWLFTKPPFGSRAITKYGCMPLLAPTLTHAKYGHSLPWAETCQLYTLHMYEKRAGKMCRKIEWNWLVENWRNKL